MKKIKEKLKSENGSITSVILVTILFFIAILSTAYMVASTLRKAQLKSEIATRDVYESDFNNIDEIYEDTIKRLGELPSTPETKPYFPSLDFVWVDGTDLDNGLVIEDRDGNQYVWVEVPKTNIVYTSSTTDIIADANGKFADDEYIAIENDLRTYTAIYRTKYVDEYCSDAATGLTSTQYTNLKNKMLQSVYQNGGFWVGKYETGIKQSTYRNLEISSITNYSTEGQIPVSQPNKYPYNYVTCSQAQTLADSMNSGNYTSSLMFGVQWDLILKYLETKGATEEELKGNVIGSTDWGNYANANFDITNIKAQYSKNAGVTWLNAPYRKENESLFLTTGANEKRNSKQNICDLAGNLWEWTLEYSANPDYPCTCRGSRYAMYGSVGPVVVRGNNDTIVNSEFVGFRTVIY